VYQVSPKKKTLQNLIHSKSLPTKTGI